MQCSSSLQKVLWGACCVGILLLTFYLRMQGVERIPDGQFTGNDAYLYYKQAQTIAEQGYLPARDMDRWLPLGRDNRQLLSLYAYAIAYTHKVFPWWSLYQIQQYLPVLCFTLAIGVLLLFLARVHGPLFATIVGLLLATFPGSLTRSAAGFADRDAWCWMLGVLAVTSYLWKERMAPGGWRWLATALAGFIVFLGGMSWEAFGAFLIIILAVELWKFCSTDTEEHLTEYLLYILMFVPWLYLISPAYHSGYGQTTHLFALTIAPPFAVFAMRGTRYLLLTYVKNLRPHARKIAWMLTLLSILSGLYYLFSQIHMFETTAFILQEPQLMKSVSELANPGFTYWILHYGTTFVFGSVGIVLGCRQLGKLKWLSFGTILSAFAAAIFLREPISQWIGNDLCNTFFWTTLALTTLSIGIACSEKKDGLTKNQRTFFLMLVWFLLWGSLARGGLRYQFFIGVPLAYGTAWLLCIAPAPLIQKLKDRQILVPEVPEQRIVAWLAIAVLIPVLFWTPLGGHATRAIYIADRIRKPLPGTGSESKALHWMKETLPENVVVATNWEYGNRINVLGGVKTITDADHYLPHWIHLYYRHVFCGQSEREALQFLKTHQVTHLLFAERDITKRAGEHSALVRDAYIDRFFQCYKLERQEMPLGASYRIVPVPKAKGTPLGSIDIIRTPPQTLFITARFRGGKQVTKTVNKSTSPISVDLENGGIVLFFDKQRRFHKGYYVPPIGWNSLAVKLYFRGEHSDAFVPVYPTNGDADAEFKIWEIHYPRDIQSDPKYLKTEIPEIDADLQHQ